MPGVSNQSVYGGNGQGRDESQGIRSIFPVMDGSVLRVAGSPDVVATGTSDGAYRHLRQMLGRDNGRFTSCKGCGLRRRTLL